MLNHQREKVYGFDTSTPKRRPKPSTNPKTQIPSSPINKLLMAPSSDIFPSKSEFLRLIVVITIASSIAISCNFILNFFNRQPKPFCDTNFSSDFCEPCPSNGVCYEGNLECVRGYRKQGKSCVEDGDINETATKLAKLTERRVCEAYSQYLCDGTGTVWAREDELWNNLDDLKLIEHYGVNEPIYIHAKERASETVGSLLETRKNNHGIRELKCPELLVESYKPLSCYIRQLVAENAIVLVPICAGLLGCALLLFKVHRRYYLSVQAEQLYSKVCDILEENALVSRSVNRDEEPWVIASWLRDHLLSPRERRDPALWKKVEELVQEDSRLDRYPKMVRGESKVVWEWQVEGSLSSLGKRRKAQEKKLELSNGNHISNQRHLVSKAGEPSNC